MIFPLLKTVLGPTTASDSFKAIDLSYEVEIPCESHVGAFGVVRKHHVHEGVDLYAEDYDPVYAMERGTVVRVGWFTGLLADSPWWENTQFVMIEGASGVINYGEIASRVAEGDIIEEGALIGHVQTVLTKDKGRPMSMLHLELYERGTREPVEWKVGEDRPRGLLDPTPLLHAPKSIEG